MLVFFISLLVFTIVYLSFVIYITYSSSRMKAIKESFFTFIKVLSTHRSEFYIVIIGGIINIVLLIVSIYKIICYTL